MYKNSKLLGNEVFKSFFVNKFYETICNNETADLFNITTTWKSALSKKLIIGWNLKNKIAQPIYKDYIYRTINIVVNNGKLKPTLHSNKTCFTIMIFFLYL